MGGQDATEAFEDVGHSDEAREILQGLLIGELKRKVCRPSPLSSLSLPLKGPPLYLRKEKYNRTAPANSKTPSLQVSPVTLHLAALPPKPPQPPGQDPRWTPQGQGSACMP